MNKKDKINDNKQQEILYLRRRLLFEEIKFQYIFGFIFCYAIVVSSFYLIILFVWESGKYNDMFLEISIFIGKIIIVLLVVGASWDNIKHNRLIKKGKVIIAQLEDDTFPFNPLLIPMCSIKIKCFYHDYKNEKLWEYTGTYTEFGRWIPNAPALSNEW